MAGKQLDVTGITNELSQGSAFFNRPTPIDTPLPSPLVREDESPKNVDKSTNRQVHKRTNQHVDKSTSLQVDKSTSPQTDKPLRRFTTYLTPDSIKPMKMIALEENKKEYEIFQEAVDDYLQKRKGE
jgi:hypothetical protein